jgi:hypothetical protein
MASAPASGYEGVRRNGNRWQAKHGKKIYGNFDDPYSAACELARQLSKPLPVEDFHSTLVALYMRIPPERLSEECERALAEVEQLRAEGGKVVEKTPPPVRKLTDAEMRKHARMGAIDTWWRHLWSSGETYHLNIQRGSLFIRFGEYEKKRLRGKQPTYEPMVDSVFLKLLKEVAGKTTPEVKCEQQLYIWVIDADKYCPPELRQQWESERPVALLR